MLLPARAPRRTRRDAAAVSAAPPQCRQPRRTPGCDQSERASEREVPRDTTLQEDRREDAARLCARVATGGVDRVRPAARVRSRRASRRGSAPART